jgi:hypothetical protein
MRFVEQCLGHGGGEFWCKKEPVVGEGAHIAFYRCQGAGRRPVGEGQWVAGGWSFSGGWLRGEEVMRWVCQLWQDKG